MSGGSGPSGVGVDLDEHLAHGARPGRLHRLDVEEPHPLVRLAGGAGKGPPDDLESRAHRQDHGPVPHAARQRPVVDERPRGADLGAVLSPTQAVDVGLGEGAVGHGLQQRASWPRHSARRASTRPFPPSP